MMSGYQQSHLDNLQRLQQSLAQAHATTTTATASSASSDASSYISTASSYQTTTSNLEQTYSRKLSNKVLSELELRTTEKLIQLEEQKQRDREQRLRTQTSQEQLSAFTKTLPSIEQHYAASRPTTANESESQQCQYQTVINYQRGVSMNSDNEDGSSNMDISMNSDSDKSLQVIHDSTSEQLGMTTTNDQDLKRRRMSQAPAPASTTQNMGQISSSSSRPTSSLSQNSLQRTLSQRKALSRTRRNSSRRASTLHELIVPLSIRSPGSSPLANGKIIDVNSHGVKSDGFTVPKIPATYGISNPNHRYQATRSSPLSSMSNGGGFSFARPTFAAMSKVQNGTVPVLRKPSSKNNLNQAYNQQAQNKNGSNGNGSGVTVKAIPTKATISQQRSLFSSSSASSTIPKSRSSKSINAGNASSIPNSTSNSFLSNLTKPTVSSLSKSKSFKGGLSEVSHLPPPSNSSTKSTNYSTNSTHHQAPNLGMRKSKSLKMGLDAYTNNANSSSSGMKKSQTMKFGLFHSNNVSDVTNNSNNKTTGMTRSRTVSGNLNNGGTGSGLNSRPAWR
ncbi:hypothetical protein WICPIJ_004649 [Wickerhamomyces pijperi]|uniref:Uncharacterized protein n=1 Tax=Wickerhamomyces pijperi TaxID=599730 RepID=A0A9P8Q533_WICPI|nr:hypothetical protein WICPIJ_004649 [Wickerhamomyces pijperi]